MYMNHAHDAMRRNSHAIEKSPRVSKVKSLCTREFAVTILMPAEILNSPHKSGIYNTEAALFIDENIRKFVETFDAQNRGNVKEGGMFMSRDGCRQSYVMPVKYKSPN